ncbi:MAG: rRNA maturation RNase YbeY [Treponema sp.]|nr:rRNA maturation RNase YbeY [Treponema sp.]
MNRVSFNTEGVPPPAWMGKAKLYILEVLNHLRKERWDVSVLLCGNNKIMELNSEYRKKNEATDILTFVQGETVRGRFIAGDIVISLQALDENTGYFGVSSDEELRRLLIHGILHLDGMDHKTNSGTEPMLELQEKILTEITGETII